MERWQIQRSRLRFSLLFVAMLVMVASLGGAALACEDDPIDPDRVIRALMFGFGGPVEQTRAIALGINTKAAVEPQVTALLTMDVMEGLPRGTVVASSQPTFDTLVNDLRRSLMLVSEAAIHALTRYF